MLDRWTRTILGQEVVRPSDDKLVDFLTELSELLITPLAVLVG